MCGDCSIARSVSGVASNSKAALAKFDLTHKEAKKCLLASSLISQLLRTTTIFFRIKIPFDWWILGQNRTSTWRVILLFIFGVSKRDGRSSFLFLMWGEIVGLNQNSELCGLCIFVRRFTWYRFQTNCMNRVGVNLDKLQKSHIFACFKSGVASYIARARVYFTTHSAHLPRQERPENSTLVMRWNILPRKLELCLLWM